MTRLCIASISTTRVDIPLQQPITMSFGVVRMQNVVLVRMRDRDGVEGVGEVSILGGPYWSEESAESVQATIENYIAPALIDFAFDGLEAIARRLAGLVRGNPIARSAVERAGLDLIGRALGVSAVDLLGGACRQTIPVAWTLSTGGTESDIEAGEKALAERGHRRFKLKFGRSTAAEDVKRAIRIIDAFSGRAVVIADVNQAWDVGLAARYFPILQEAGLEAIEQPLVASDVAGIARLRERTGIEVIADEAITGPDAAFRIAASGAASVLSLKPSRDGGLMASRRVAAVAHAAGLGLYGGSMLETSLGTAASAHLYATIPALPYGCELFGPLKLTEDIAQTPFTVNDGVLTLPSGPGLGVDLDEDKIAFLTKAV